MCREGPGCLTFLSGPTSPLSQPTISHCGLQLSWFAWNRLVLALKSPASWETLQSWTNQDSGSAYIHNLLRAALQWWLGLLQEDGRDLLSGGQIWTRPPPGLTDDNCSFQEGLPETKGGKFVNYVLLHSS